ncbi:MAG: exodeoxyribonuclease VII large subunit [Candidatus Staskawiczbacteria bacterium]|nr:exodeoxyribonuclease VII large subunit [Candidatus Staskawiczbacteria bacterium]
MEIEKDKIYSISEFVAFLNEDLKWMKAKIVGEVGEAKAGPTGHMYFTLKDEKDGSMLNCIMWSSKYRLFGITLEPGKKIVAYGSPNIYAQNGRLSFVCDTIELAGEGDIKKQYDELKAKLTKEGLFNVENKRAIPQYAHKIGVITSKQGAVIHDFLNNIGKFGFDIKMIDSRVEGQGAVEDLLSAIQTFRKKDIDVLVIIRGGGSMESLMPFNNELLVREVAGFPVPVLVGIGHDKDVPLVAMAADKSESTPTAVANLLNESWEQALLLLERFERRIFASYGLIFEKYKKIENRFKISLQNFSNNLLNIKISLEKYSSNYFSKFGLLCDKTKEKLQNIEKIVNLNNPERNLKLGYSIASVGGKIIRKTSDVKIGENLDIKVSDGIISSEIKNIN